MINEAIQKCDVDVRRDMWGGVVLTGGGALLPGLRERLEQVHLFPNWRWVVRSLRVSSLTACLPFHMAPAGANETAHRLAGSSTGAAAGGAQSSWAESFLNAVQGLAELAPPASRLKVVSPANSTERRFSVWIGACRPYARAHSLLS